MNIWTYFFPSLYERYSRALGKDLMARKDWQIDAEAIRSDWESVLGAYPSHDPVDWDAIRERMPGPRGEEEA